MSNHNNSNEKGSLSNIGSPKKPIDRQRLIENGKQKSPFYSEFSDVPKGGDKKPEAPEPHNVPIRELFRFATKWDMLLYLIGIPCALLNGAAWPFLLVIMGDTVDSLVAYRFIDQMLDRADFFMEANGWDREYIYKHIDEFIPMCPNISRMVNYTAVDCEDLEKHGDIFGDMVDQSVQYCYVGIAVLVCAFLQVNIFISTSERQVIRMRKAFYKNILRQDMAWFDVHSAGELTVKLTDDIHKIHDAIGDKTGTSLQWFGSAVAGLTVAFMYGWKLSLVMVTAAPALAVSFGILAKATGDMTAKERVAYAQAGAVAEEVFSSVRTVAAFGGQEKEAKRYKDNLINAQHFGIQKGRMMGMSIGVAWFIIYCFLAVGFYYGGKLVREGEYEVKDMIVVFMSSLIGSFSIGLASPAFSLVKVGCGAAYEVFRIIDTKSTIDSMSDEGQKPRTVKGIITFKNVHFSYPTRPSVKILDGFNLTVSPGQTVALVGHSGCGKSTITQLLLRFYDAASGQVSLDGVNVKNLNVKHLREHIGIVSQEPVLFPTTVAENIRYGREDVTKEEIIEATKKANAYDFIMSMPNGFDCYVGERGAQLSGGQKQRIAIARSLVREPCVLLLDEATSALDRHSEATVQDALDKASVGRTTLVIAHRLSTIRHADTIVVMDKGRVVEQGTHDTLMADGGIYHSLVNTQSKKYDPQENDGTEDTTEKENLVVRDSEVEASLNRQLSFTEEVEDESVLTVSRGDAIRRLSRLTAPDWIYNVIGGFSSLYNGAVQPIWGFLLAETLVAFTKNDDDEEKEVMNKLSFCCLGLAVTSLFSNTAQHYYFSISGERLIGRIRSIAFKAMLRQEIGWFDDEKHQSAALGAQLAEKATLVQGAVQSISMSILLSLGVLGTALILSFIFSWKLTLVTAAFVPLTVLSGVMAVKENQGMSKSHKTTLEDASNEAMSAVANIRTVASLTKEGLFLQGFCNNLDECYKYNFRTTLTMATALAVSSATYYFTFATVFYYGSILLEDDDIGAVDVFRVFNCIVLSSVQLGRMVAVVPDTKGALRAARQIFGLEDAVPAIDPYSTEGYQPDPKSVQSSIKFSNVQFRYPMRQDVKVLKGLDLQVDSGEMLALVGESGSGKSTVVQLLERFYHIGKGAVTMDKYNITHLNVQWLRQQIGLVAQEPVLFDTSVAENIAYGDNTRDVSMDEIISAAKSANIHNFIQSLPLGYDTNVGNKGTQLSGGQKQRIAIARALVRNPKILLLDEATSALDAESEKVVQDALDRAREGRTCITIAHRLSTIKNADKIAVIRNGVVHEQGTHAQLMNKHGLYYHLQTQS